MNFAESQRNPGKHPTGLIIVVIMHVLLAYALVSGLAKKVVDVIKVTETKVVDAPPPPPPPPPKDLPPPPKNLPPPPVYVPPPPVDVPPPPPQPNPIATTDQKPIAAPERRIEPTAPSPSPGPAPVARSAVINANDPSCRPEFPAAALRAQVSGVSRIRFTVDATGKVTAAEVVGSSGPTREHRLLDNAAKLALPSCPIKVGTDAEGHPIGTQVEVAYSWKLE
ncbi:MAG: TonB family protein [Burkholderiaceae bacterium]